MDYKVIRNLDVRRVIDSWHLRSMLSAIATHQKEAVSSRLAAVKARHLADFKDGKFCRWHDGGVFEKL